MFCQGTSCGSMLIQLVQLSSVFISLSAGLSWAEVSILSSIVMTGFIACHCQHKHSVFFSLRVPFCWLLFSCLTARIISVPQTTANNRVMGQRTYNCAVPA